MLKTPEEIMYGENILTISVKYNDADLHRLKKIENGDWIDLYCAEDVVLHKDEFKLISLGVVIELPDGYEAHMVPRSSTFKNYGIIMTNSVGIIDNSYKGPNDVWRFPAYCVQPKSFVDGENVTVIHKNDRICQFRLVKNMDKVRINEIKIVKAISSRGGIGSTGI